MVRFSKIIATKKSKSSSKKPKKADKREKKMEKAKKIRELEKRAKQEHAKKKRKHEVSIDSSDSSADSSSSESDYTDDLDEIDDNSSSDSSYDINDEVKKSDIREEKKNKMNDKIRIDIIKRDYVDVCSQIHAVAKSIKCDKDDKARISNLVYYYIKYFLYSCCIKKKPVFDWLEEFKDKIHIY